MPRPRADAEMDVGGFLGGFTEQLNAFLRTMAPGFLGLIVWRFDIGTRLDSSLDIGLGTPWNAFAVGFALALMAYAVNVALLEDILVRVAIGVVRRWHPNEGPSVMNQMSDRDRIALLSRERWARSASRDRRVATMQERVDHYSSWLMFLYGTALVLLALWLVVAISYGLSWYSRPSYLGMSGAVALGLGLVTDFKITRHEIWLVASRLQWPHATHSRKV